MSLAACSGKVADEDMSSSSSTCGNGVVDPGEACDGDTAAGYCTNACTSVAPPILDLSGSATGDAPAQSLSFSFSSMGGLGGYLPSAGDAAGCGALQVVERTTELVRVTARVCYPGVGVQTSVMTWTVALPLVEGTKVSSTDADFDAAKWQPTATLEDNGKRQDFGPDFDVTLESTPPSDGFPLSKGGTVHATYGTAGGPTASFDMTFNVTPPPVDAK